MRARRNEWNLQKLLTDHELTELQEAKAAEFSTGSMAQRVTLRYLDSLPDCANLGIYHNGGNIYYNLRLPDNRLRQFIILPTGYYLTIIIPTDYEYKRKP